MNIKKTAALFLAAAALLCLASCGNGTGEDTVPATEGPALTAAPEATTEALDEWGRPVETDGIPETLRFDGETLKILSREDSKFRWQLDFYARDESGIKVNDAVYRRNERIRERLGIDIEVTERPGSYNEFDAYAAYITRSYSSGSGDFDLAGTYSIYGARYATNGYFENIYDLDRYIDLDRVWWNSTFRDDMTVNDKLYFLVGDMNLTTLSRMLVTYCNKQELDSRVSGLNLYREVIDGGWTIERMHELTSSVYSDVNGNGSADSGDFFGIVSTAPSEAYDGFGVALDIGLIVRNDAGEWSFTENTDRVIEACEKTADLYFKGVNPSYFDSLDNVQTMFANDRALFMVMTLDKSTESIITDMKADFGILPLPKLNADQASYYTVPQDAFNLISIVRGSTHTDMVAAAAELMSAGSYQTVTPVYFDDVLKYRYMRDSESGQMLEICRAGLRMDFATVNTLSLNDSGRWFRNTMHGAKENAGANAAVRLKLFSRTIGSYLDSFVSSYN